MISHILWLFQFFLFWYRLPIGNLYKLCAWSIALLITLESLWWHLHAFKGFLQCSLLASIHFWSKDAKIINLVSSALLMCSERSVIVYFNTKTLMSMLIKMLSQSKLRVWLSTRWHKLEMEGGNIFIYTPWQFYVYWDDCSDVTIFLLCKITLSRNEVWRMWSDKQWAGDWFVLKMDAGQSESVCH